MENYEKKLLFSHAKETRQKFSFCPQRINSEQYGNPPSEYKSLQMFFDDTLEVFLQNLKTFTIWLTICTFSNLFNKIFA